MNPPNKLDAKHQELIDDLNHASVEDFDKHTPQVDGHQEKQFAEKTLPTIGIIWMKRKSCHLDHRRQVTPVSLESISSIDRASVAEARGDPL